MTCQTDAQFAAELAAIRARQRAELHPDPELEARIMALVARIEPLENGSPEYLEIERELMEIAEEGELANDLVDYYYWSWGDAVP